MLAERKSDGHLLVEAAKPKVHYVMSGNSFLPFLLIFPGPFFIPTSHQCRSSFPMFLSHVPFPYNGFSNVSTQLFHTALQLTKMGDVTVWQGSAGEPPAHQYPKVLTLYFVSGNRTSDLSLGAATPYHLSHEFIEMAHSVVVLV